MTRQEEQRILDILGQDFPAVTEAIRNPEKRYQHATLPLLGVYLTPTDLTPDLFDRFRKTDWVVEYLGRVDGRTAEASSISHSTG